MKSYTLDLFQELDIRSEELQVLRSDIRGFARVLCNLPLHIDYVTTGEPGFTDAKGNIALDGNVAQDKDLSFYRKADVLKGVLLDEVGHNIWLPPTKDEKGDAAYLLAAQTKKNPNLIRPLLHTAINLIEDLHNVTTLCTKFPGFQPLHVVAVEHYMGARMQETLEKYEAELAIGKPPIGTFLNALICVTKARLPSTGALKKAAEMALASTAMHYTEQRLGQARRLTRFLIENALLPELGPEENKNGEGEKCKGGGSNEGGKKQPGKSNGDKEKETKPSAGEGQEQEKAATDGDQEQEDGNTEKDDADLLAELIEQVANLPEITENAGMGNPAPIPEDAKRSLEDVAGTVVRSEGGANIHRHKKGTCEKANFQTHPEANHLALVAKQKIKNIKTKPGYGNPGYRRGKLLRRDVHKVATKKVTPFSKPGKPDEPSLNIALVVDWSGSMHTGRAEGALQLIDIMAKATRNLPDVDLWAMLYTTSGVYNTNIHVVAEPGWTDPKLFCRFTGYRTPTLPALREAVRLTAQGKPTIIVLVTDGMANVGGSEYQVQQWIQDNRKQHKIISIYISPAEAQQVYAENRKDCYIFPSEIGMKEIIRMISIINREIMRIA